MYRTILIDPPWSESGGGRVKRGADRHYDLMKTDDIIQFLLDELDGKIDQSGCHLYLWATNNYLRDGFKVLDALGFRYVTIITWQKDRMGLGQYFRGITEHCLFGIVGKLPYKMDEDGKRQQGVTGFIEKRKQHSQKPERMYQMIETVSYPPRLELFARTSRKGWDSMGNELDHIPVQVGMGL